MLDTKPMKGTQKMRIFRISLSSALLVILLIAGLFTPVSQAYAISEWPFDEELKDLTAEPFHYTPRKLTVNVELVPSEAADPHFLRKPANRKAALEVRYYLNGEKKDFPTGDIKAALVENLKVPFNKTIKNLRNSLNTCIKKLEEATKKKSSADQDKAMKIAVDALNKDYRKYLSALPGELYDAVNKGKQLYANSNNKSDTSEMRLKLFIGGSLLPAAPGFGSIFSSSKRDIKKEHDAALNWMDYFTLATNFTKSPSAEVPFSFYARLSHNWQHSVHAFINCNEKLGITLDLPGDLTNEQFSEVCQKVRDFLFAETSKFDTSVLKTNNDKFLKLVINPKMTQKDYDKLATERTSALQKEHTALKKKMPDAIDKIVQNALGSYPSHKGNRGLRNYGVDRLFSDANSFSGEYSNLEVADLDGFTTIEQTALLNTLNSLNGSIATITIKTGECIASIQKFSQELSNYALSINNKSSSDKKGSAIKSEFKSLRETFLDAKHSSNYFEYYREQITELKIALAVIERTLVTNKASLGQKYQTAMTALPKVYKFIEEISPLFVFMDRVSAVVSEYEAMIDNMDPYNDDKELLAFMKASSFSMSKAITKLNDSFPLIAFDNLHKDFASAIGSISDCLR